MVKAIVFDFMGVLGTENNCPLSPTEELLEKTFGNHNTDAEYYDWAREQTGLSHDEIEKITVGVYQKLYQLREPEILTIIPAGIKIALATNTPGCFRQYLEAQEWRKYFDAIIISGEISAAKPNKRFYKIMIEQIGEKPEDVLFIDDRPENVDAAKKLGILAVRYVASAPLQQLIREYLLVR